MIRHSRAHRSVHPIRVGALALGVALAGLAVGTVAGRLTIPDAPGSTLGSPAAAEPVAVAATPAPAPTPETATFTIVAAGDVLPHLPVNASAHQPDGSFDYSGVLSGADPWIQGADLALCHMEVPVAPAGTTATGYPRFAARSELVRDLREQGWDGCSTASNHSVDQGFAGVSATLDTFDAAGLGHVGTARTQTESLEPQLYTLVRAGRTITVAHVSATFGTNGLPVPSEAPWSVALLDTDAIVAEATAAREAGADLVVVSLHAGVEYTTTLTAQQVDATRALSASGQVDLVIGHHAHVPQAIERLDGGPEGGGTWVAYGLGNYISNQDAGCCVPSTSSGVLLTATVVQEPGGPARVSGVEWSAVTVDRAGDHAVHVVEDVLDAPDGVGTLDHTELVARLALVRDAVGTAATERTAPPTPTGPAAVVVPRSADPQADVTG